MSTSISVFLPTRKGSERVKDKNTRPFGNYSNGLLELKLTQLLKLKEVDEIILSTNDEKSMAVGELFIGKEARLKIIERPNNLALSSTSLTDLVSYVPSICSSDNILWTHVTSPFVNEKDYSKAIIQYFSDKKNGFDSLMSVKCIQNFLWSEEKNDIINRKSNLRWPRTQDLQKLYEIDSAIFIAPKSTYIQEADRIGKSPTLFLQEGFKSVDVDWEDDFKLAEMIYQNIYDTH